MANSTSKYVLLAKWASGATETLEIPQEPWPGRDCPLLEVGPRTEEPCATVPVYASTGPTLCEVIVHGSEIPSMLVCPAPLGPFSCSGDQLTPGEQIVNDGHGRFPVPTSAKDLDDGTPTHQLRVAWPDGRVDRHSCRAGDVLTIGPEGSYEREFTVHDPDDRAARVTVRVRGEAPRLVLLSVEALRLTAEAFDVAFGDPDVDVTHRTVGFDLRAQHMPLVLPWEVRSVRYEFDGRATTVTGERQALKAFLEAAGYEVVDPGEAPTTEQDRIVGPTRICRHDDRETTPEWLAEFMHELGCRHSLRTPDGCEAAMHEAAKMSNSFGFRCRSCASLVRGYRSAGGALAAIRDADQEGWARHNEEASRHFREAIDLARAGEELGA